MKQSQNMQVLRLLKLGRRLTPLAALRLFGCFRLSARIYELRMMGVAIHSGRRTLPDGKIVAEYFL